MRFYSRKLFIFDLQPGCYILFTHQKYNNVHTKGMRKMITVLSADLLTMEQYREHRDIIPSICGGYWLRSAPSGTGPEANMHYIWSDMTSTIECSSRVTCEAGIRPVLTVSGIETETTDEAGFIHYGGYRWRALDGSHMVSEKAFGRMRFCRNAKGMASYETSDVKSFIDTVILPELQKRDMSGTEEPEVNFYHLASIFVHTIDRNLSGGPGGITDFNPYNGYENLGMAM